MLRLRSKLINKMMAEVKMSVTLDDIFSDHVGEYGRYQKIVTTVLLISRSLVAMVTADVVYLSLTPDTFCMGSNGDTSAMSRNVTNNYGSACWCFAERDTGYQLHYDMSQYGTTIVTDVRRFFSWIDIWMGKIIFSMQNWYKENGIS